ncbi:MAG: hypothetical protein A2X48_23950 [Lentisphaerae bacterium GWF2_49_21]|nr:MAG: hypothetical protein A2X48_23950 [Lentisphaerae bacterium GWF2_49_21]
MTIIDVEKIKNQCKELRDSLAEIEFKLNGSDFVPLEDYGKTVKEKRKLTKMTQMQLATIAGISTGCLKKIEKGSKNVSLENAEKVLNSIGKKLYIR